MDWGLICNSGGKNLFKNVIKGVKKANKIKNCSHPPFIGL